MIQGFRRRRLPRLGKLRVGEKAISAKGTEYPKDLDYFVVPDEVAAVYGPTPREIVVMVPCVDINKFFPCELKYYGKDKLICHGDGEVATCYNNQSGEWEERPCLYHECPHYQAKNCTEVGNLQVILPEVNVFGVYQIDTGSFHGINNFYNAYEAFLDQLTTITGDPDSVLRVQFKLVREPQTLEYNDNGVRKTVVKSIINLKVPALTYAGALEMAASFRAPQLPAAAQAALPAADEAIEGELEGEYIPGEAELPEPDDAQPKDLYPGASPAGPSLGQRDAWAALLEQAQELGKNIAALETSVVGMTSRDAKSFTDLAGEGEAPEAIERLSTMVTGWQKDASKATKPKATPAPAPTPEPAAEPQSTLIDPDEQVAF